MISAAEQVSIHTNNHIQIATDPNTYTSDPTPLHSCLPAVWPAVHANAQEAQHEP